MRTGCAACSWRCHIPSLGSLTPCLPPAGPFGNPLFLAPGLSPSPGLQNPVFSPATLGTAPPPSSAAGLRRLGFLPRSQLSAGAAEQSPGSEDEEMAEDGEGLGGGEGEVPAASLAVASPGGGAAAGSASSRERPEEDEFASVLGAGALA